METLESSGDIVSQKDALKLYLDALLCEPGSKGKTPIVDKAVQLTPTEELFNSVLLEINCAEERIRAPRWASEYFSCLPITVAEITLFVPLRQVRTVLPFTQDIQAIEDTPDWIQGSMVNSIKNIKVVDMQKIVYQKIPLAEHIEPAAQLVVISDGKWGLSCNAVGKVQQLNRNEVNWRAKNTETRWINGLSMKHQLSIVDIKRIEFAMALESPLV